MTDQVNLGKLRRRKGRAYEQQVARDCRAAGLDARRGLQSRDGSEAPDVVADPLSIECKHGKRPNVVAALMQAQENANKGTYPVAVCKQDGCDAVAVLFWSDLLEIVATLTFAGIWGTRGEP